jgi:hypothetical protein
MVIRALKALDPIWFRFTDPQDIGKYGEQWMAYDESRLMRLPGRTLLGFEESMDMPLVKVMNEFRKDTTIGDLAVAWLSLAMLDPARAGAWDEFNPIVNLIEWTGTDPVGKGEGPETAPESSSTISAPTDTVVLPNMPISGSPT